VFTGRVLSIDRVVDGTGPAGTRQRRVRVLVAERFRGSGPAPGAVAIVFTTVRCGYAFKAGADYLIYARTREDGASTTEPCSGTVPLDRGADGVEYGRLAARNAAPHGGVVGAVRYAAEHDSRRTPVAGVAVTATGPAGVETTSMTDARGRYKIDVPTAGRYALSVDLPATSYAEPAERTIELSDPRACVERDIDVLFDGRLTGQVVDSHGKGVAGLTIAHVRLKKDGSASSGRTRVLTHDDGTFRIDGVAPGAFAVVIELAEEHEGIRGVLGGGERLPLQPIVLPPDLRVLRLEGSVHGPDGTPAAGARVFLKDAGDEGHIVGEAAVADDLGRFVLAVIEDGGYQVFAERQAPTSSGPDFSDPVPVTPRAGMPPLRLTVRRRF
jgi:hypothetical protein